MKTKNPLKKIAAAFTAVAILSVGTACSNDDNAVMPPQQKTIAAVVSENSNFSMLKAAVTKAGLAETLNGAGPFTVFAPDNAAFSASGLTEQSVNNMSAEDLKDVLLYHTVSGKIMAANVPEGPNAEVSTVNGMKIYVTKDTRGVFVNGWKVKSADIAASNGVIHYLERVLMPAMGTIVQTAQSNDNMTFLVAAVLRASQGSTNVAAALSAQGNMTVFAPTNQAFMNAGFPTIASIQNADPDMLAGILTYHVLATRAFSSDLRDGATLTTLNGGNITVALGSQATVKGNGNTMPATIGSMNIMATNGVIHVIDSVLLP
ncbi:Uncaracterized surface protein containing fasciclin (FAS1) repeats [Paenimyroides ummariense]|uniref:Uncaracterized surface protein containing fasciclin (FAS1) repeats n=1 Tax=Paenimyroides ummariense TaxID=913024 RepID=A0A1I4XXC4_9FLAO|nr:fasciclin domain-containing protein [Paenimyroides ummariense]SFN30386.1 Uncaracterized surface protein containing fasciclin (FAS1) repeats [Paenimyroides ummariense]